jgi:hypothetical protein
MEFSFFLCNFFTPYFSFLYGVRGLFLVSLTVVWSAVPVRLGCSVCALVTDLAFCRRCQVCGTEAVAACNIITPYNALRQTTENGGIA